MAQILMIIKPALRIPSHDYCFFDDSDEIMQPQEKLTELDICICVDIKFWGPFFNSVSGAKVVVLKFDGG
ncbi:MAG: hypothetical protein EZS28_014667 [Streblomastix strix]|uniref:Uncharacterized protein n=1 Tax=Streblomastix strix TaxID=222440 RepID=A0A5J4W4J0_9EUKA|nr:MAG: hypothetical protein EZS28_014667 [Streblomastix strix]